MFRRRKPTQAEFVEKVIQDLRTVYDRVLTGKDQEIERLRAQVRELLPIVVEISEYQSTDREYGTCSWDGMTVDCAGWEMKNRKSAATPRNKSPRLSTLDSHHPSCPVHKACRIVTRIEAGEFGEVK
jgi:hypothetical protein